MASFIRRLYVPNPDHDAKVQQHMPSATSREGDTEGGRVLVNSIPITVGAEVPVFCPGRLKPKTISTTPDKLDWSAGLGC